MKINVTDNIVRNARRTSPAKFFFGTNLNGPSSSAHNGSWAALGTLLVLLLAAPLLAAPVPRDAASRAGKAKSAREATDPRFDAAQVRSGQAKLDRAKRYPKLVQRLESRLLDAWEQAGTEGALRAAKALGDSGVQVQGTNVVVIVQCASNAIPKEVADLIAARKGTVIRTGEAHVKAVVPILDLDQIANLPGVSFVRTTIRKREKNTVITEGRAAMLASAWNAAGFTGQGVKVAIMDVDFLGLPALKASGEIPASAVEMDFSGTGMTTGIDGHGCACAELIYDLAPGVQMYLLKSLDPSDDEAAKNYCKVQGVQIISQSGGYDVLNFHDGVAYSSITPHPVTIVNDANANGILWVNAAGNEQRQYALATWRDSDNDKYLDWEPAPYYWPLNELWNGGNVISAGEVLEVYLTWNEWPVTAQDFDLDLYRLDGTTWTHITSAEAPQTGTQPPREHLLYTVTTAARYAVGIYKFSATRSPSFILLSYPYELFYFGYNNIDTPAPGSLTIPADAAASFTVGAIDYTTYTTGPIEGFSSLGPNNGAYTGNPTVVKPDICGPDWVSTVTFGTESFGGTSASTPHIAGLAALVKGAYPSYTAAQIRSYIESNGFDLGSVGKDNTYGSGAARLPAPPAVPRPLIQSVVVTNGAALLAWSAVAGVTYRVQVQDQSWRYHLVKPDPRPIGQWSDGLVYEPTARELEVLSHRGALTGSVAPAATDATGDGAAGAVVLFGDLLRLCAHPGMETHLLADVRPYPQSSQRLFILGRPFGTTNGTKDTKGQRFGAIRMLTRQVSSISCKGNSETL